jgi:integrase
LRCEFLPDRKIPTLKKAGEDWIELKKQNVRASTAKMYEGHLEHHFDDDIKVNRITTAKVEKIISAKQQTEMNITTLRKILITFNQVMNYAVRHGYIGYNPVRDAERPKGQGELGKDSVRVLTPAEINKFLRSVSDLKYRTLFQLAIMSGARQGELLGLKWDRLGA